MKSQKIIPDFIGTNGKYVKSVTNFYVTHKTKSYSVWLSMCARCKDQGYYQKRKPTYAGCTMSEMFKDFNTFAIWHVNQIGYGEAEYQLDKDLLCAGNKHYSEQTCVLIPRQLNMFLADSEGIRGEYPVGVCKHTKNNSYIASISVGSTKNKIGSYDDPWTAYLAYKKAKEKEAARWVSRIVSGEFIVDERVLERLKVWELELEPIAEKARREFMKRYNELTKEDV